MTRTVASLLERLATQRYRALERSLTVGVGEREALFRLGRGPNMSWHAAHLAHAIATTHEALFGEPSPHSGTPLGDGDAPWPASRDDALSASSNLLSSLASTLDTDLAMPPQVTVLEQFRELLSTRQRFLEGHIYHVAYHVGSMAVLRAEQGLDARTE